MGDIAHQLGFAEQTDWATQATVNRFIEFTQETLERTNTIATSNGIRSGRRYGGQGRRVARQSAGGTVTTEIATKGFGMLFKHLLGDVATVNTSTAYTHTFTPASLLDMGLTLQKGVQQSDGTVQPFTYPGTKIVSADFSVDQDGILLCTWTFDSKQELTATALAAASYASPFKVFTYSEGAVLVDSVEVASVRSVGSVSIVNNLLVDRVFLGNNGLKSEQINTPFDSISGNLDVEFQDPADFYTAFAADTSVELVLEFVGAQIAATGLFETFRITIADARFEGETPQVSGPELVYQDIPFVGLDPASGDAVTIEYITTDTTP